MPLYRTTFAVKASPERVWEVLTDFDHYPEWNPQIPTITGTPEAGATVTFRLAFPKRPSLGVSAKLGPVTPPREFWWKGHVLAPWFFSGERQFSIAADDGATAMVTHGEHITGLIAPIFKLLMGGPVKQSHDAVNAALRARCEQ